MLLRAALVLFVATRIYILFAYEPQSGDIALYHHYGTRVVAGDRPYTDAFPVEYPPLALWAMAAPQAAAHGQASFEQYRHAFRLEMAVCDAAALALLVAIVRRRRPEVAGWIALAHVAATACLGDVLYDRLDLALAALVLAWAYAWVCARYVLAYALLGVGVAFKLVPVVVVPALLACELREPRRLAIAIAAVGAAALAPFAVQLALSGTGALELFRTHAARGIQIESTYATIAWVAAQLGAPVEVSVAYGSVNLIGPLADALKVVAIVALVAIVAAGAVSVWHRPDRAYAYRVACATLIAAVAASHVLSPQFLLWALPVALLLAAELGAPKAAAAVVALAATTAWVFPHHYVPDIVGTHFPGPVPRTLAHAVLGLRNAGYVALVVWLVRLTARSRPERSSCYPYRG